MKIDWQKKKNSLRWAFGCGVFYCIYQIFFEKNIFNGKNELWADFLFLI